MKRFLLLLSVALSVAVRAADAAWDDDPLVRPGDTVVLIGDSITEQGFRNPWGYYHVLTNAVRGVNFIPLGYSGYQVKSWSDMERKSVKEDVWTWYREPAGWNLKTVFDGRVDVVMIFLGMNDILQPSIRDDEADVTRWLADYADFVANLRSRCHPRQFLFATVTPLTGDMRSPKNQVRLRLVNRLVQLAGLFDAAVVDFGAAIEGEQDVLARSVKDYRLVPDFVHPNALGHKCLAQCFCEDTGLHDEADSLQDEIDGDVAELVALNGLNLVVKPLGVSRPSDAEYLYALGYKCITDTLGLVELKLRLPAGWSADLPQTTGNEGKILLRGKPEALKTRIVVEARLPGEGATRMFSADVPAPWRVREDDGPWTFYTATADYTGGAAPGSLDPYQVSFGWKTGRFTAARRVWSEKARDVKAVLSRQGFSETLDLTVSLDGAEVWKDTLNRRERNRVEKTLHLKEGWNALEIVSVHHDWQRQFSFDLEPLAGDDLSRLKYDLR